MFAGFQVQAVHETSDPNTQKHRTYMGSSLILIRVPYYIGDRKRDPNLENYLHAAVRKRPSTPGPWTINTFIYLLAQAQHPTTQIVQQSPISPKLSTCPFLESLARVSAVF